MVGDLADRGAKVFEGPGVRAAWCAGTGRNLHSPGGFEPVPVQTEQDFRVATEPPDLGTNRGGGAAGNGRAEGNHGLVGSGITPRGGDELQAA